MFVQKWQNAHLILPFGKKIINKISTPCTLYYIDKLCRFVSVVNFEKKFLKR